MASALFTPFTMRGLTLPNRIVVSPMCQHTAEDGCANDWHMLHLGTLAVSNAGLVMIESTAVERDGRISHGCLGLWSDECEQALRRVVESCRALGNVPLGIQLSHSGRKGSSQRPWEGGRAIPQERGGWMVSAPSPLPFESGGPLPHELSAGELARIAGSFAEAARRAARVGLDLAEVHMAHGYLLHSFLSPLANRRTDSYGGSAERAMRLPLEVFEAVRAAWPAERPLGARITGTDWVEGGVTLDDAVALARELKARGCDYICVSSGGIAHDVAIPYAPGYMAPFAERIRREAGIATRAVGHIVAPSLADSIVRDGQADMVAIGRGFLDNPRWPWHAARDLGETIRYKPQYQKSHPAVWRARSARFPDAAAS